MENRVETDWDGLNIVWLVASHHLGAFEGRGDTWICSGIYVLIWRSATDPSDPQPSMAALIALGI